MEQNDIDTTAAELAELERQTAPAGQSGGASTVRLADSVTSLKVRFEHLPKTEKGPIARVLVSLPAPLIGMVAECAIFAERDKSGAQTGVTVTLPGGSARFPAFKADKQTLVANGVTYRLQDDDPEGLRKIGAWGPAIKTAYHASLQDGGKAEQRITLG